MEALIDRLGIHAVATEGMEYISLTRDAEKALAFVARTLNEKKYQTEDI